MRVSQKILTEMIARIEAQGRVIVKPDGSPTAMPKPLSKQAQRTPVLDILLDLRDARRQLENCSCGVRFAKN